MIMSVKEATRACGYVVVICHVRFWKVCQDEKKKAHRRDYVHLHTYIRHMHIVHRDYWVWYPEHSRLSELSSCGRSEAPSMRPKAQSAVGWGGVVLIRSEMGRSTQPLNLDGLAS